MGSWGQQLWALAICALAMVRGVCGGVVSQSIQDMNALLDFRTAVTVDPTNALDSWKQGNLSALCSWTGVKCDSSGRVQNLTLSNLRLQGSISPSLANLSSLQVLDLSLNNLSGPIPPICGWMQLQHLVLTSNKLVGGLPLNLSQCQGLQRMRLGSNNLTGNISSEIGQITTLSYFEADSNGLSGSIPKELSSCNLSFLSLSFNNLTGTLPPELGQLKFLESLSVAHNHIGGVIPAELGLIPELQSLSLANNKLTGSIPAAFGSFSKLSLLDLSGNLLRESIPSQLGYLTYLETLCLSGNFLTGEIPSSFKNLNRLFSLELANNFLNGTIPAELGSIYSLQQVLNLSHNKLTGSIPQELAQLNKLVSLDLSYNSLSGQIPASLTSMLSLLNLSLAYNDLWGQVPQTTAHVNFSAASFVGNTGLCGPPLANSCRTFAGRQGIGGSSSIPVWAAVVIGLGVFISALTIIAVLFGYWRLRSQLAPTALDPWPFPPPEGRLLVDANKATFGFTDVVAATDNLTAAQVVGKGRFSTVFKVIMPGGKELAVKRLKSDNENSSLNRRFTLELVKLDKVRHPNILGLLGFILRGDCIQLLYDFMPNGSLGEWLHHNVYAVVDWTARYKVALGVAQGLAYLHGCYPAIIHRDVNSNNILLDAFFEPRIGDVGLAKLFDPSKDTESMTAVAGSIGYIAPEYAYTMRVTEKGNVYSYGVVLLEILTGRQPVHPGYPDAMDLVAWVHSASSRAETPEQILDAGISTVSFDTRQEMLQVLKIALLCTAPSPSERPQMKGVVDMLQRVRRAS